MNTGKRKWGIVIVALGFACGAVADLIVSGKLIMNNSTATGQSATAEGENNTASGYVSHAEGVNNVASGGASHAEGTESHAVGWGAHAQGYQTRALGNYSHAEGGATTSSTWYAHSQGSNTKAEGNSSHAQGRYTKASGTASHAAGEWAHAAHSRTFVWSDGTAFASTTTNQFSVYAANGIRLLGGAIVGDGSGLTIPPQGDIPMGIYTNGQP